jgi:glycosyltransferase involved in cell wall biosynthesis
LKYKRNSLRTGYEQAHGGDTGNIRLRSRKDEFMTEKRENPKISIVIPAYNVEKYIGKCVTSLIEQTFTDYEIIAVNDGSSDNTLEILRHFENRYPFFTVIDQKNSGISQTRNAGLAAARGEYICFINSDDFVAPTYLSELYNACVETYWLLFTTRKPISRRSGL